MSLPFKAPVNYRGAPVRVGTPEGISISGGLAMLSEAPADPTNPATPVVVVVGGGSRTRVTGAPAAGQYRIKSQTVIASNGSARTEYLPTLEFHASDEGASGTVDYYATGTILTSEWVDALMWLLTPITGVATLPALQAAYPASALLTAPGRPGRIAFLTDHSMYASDGSQWFSVAANVSPNNWSEAMGLTPRLGVQSTSAFAAAWTAARTLAHALGFSSVESYVASGIAAAMPLGSSLTLAASSAFAASWANAQALAAVLGFGSSESYSAPSSGYTDDFSSNTIANYTVSGADSGDMSIGSGTLNVASSAIGSVANGTVREATALRAWATADRTFSVKFSVGSFGGGTYVTGYISRTDANNFLYWSVDSSGGAINLGKNVAGSFSSLGQYTFTPSLNTVYTISVVRSGTANTLSVNGTARITSASGGPTGAGSFGLEVTRVGYETAWDEESFPIDWALSASDVHFDDLSVT